MLRRLFKSRNRLNHPDAAVRKAAILALDAAAAQGIADEIARLLQHDPDMGVRIACMAHVRDPALLRPLLDDPRLGRAAAERLTALGHPPPQASEAPPAAGGGLLDLPLAEALDRVRAADDVDTLIDVALAARGELRDAALAHPLMSRATALNALEKRSRHRDKTLNRHARNGIERIRSLHHEADAARGRAEELAAALARNAPALRDRAWRERQHQLHARLVEALDAYAEQRRALQACGEALPDLEHLRPDPDTLPSLAEAASAEASAEAPAAESGDPAPAAATAPPQQGDVPPNGSSIAGPGAADPFEPLVAEFQALDAALAEGREFEPVAAQRDRLTDRWLTAADHRPPSEAQHRVFESVSHRFREVADAMERLAAAELPGLPDAPLELPSSTGGRLPAELWRAVDARRAALRRLDKALRQVQWPGWAGPPPRLASLLEAQGRLQQEMAAADRLLAEEHQRLENLLTELATAIDEGHLAPAQSLLGQARSLIDALPPAGVRELGKRLGRQAARLAELKDWQTFATTPKRESLVGAVESLAQSPLPPRDQAERIKALRQQWQALGPVTQAVDGELADRFNALADQAFETCRAYFAELAAVRKANLTERVRICDQLETYLAETDWPHADMKAAERIMRAARDEWRRFHPVDRGPGRAVEQRFEALQARLHDAVKAEWERNLAAKEAIVEEARQLLASEQPVGHKITAAKTLQQRWREVGITPRRPDQRLWREFRAVCDGIFSARERAREAAEQAAAEQERQCRAAIEELAAHLDTLAPADASPAELRGFRERTAGVDRLPPGRRRALTERRTELVGRYQALLETRAREQRREELRALEAWDRAPSGSPDGSPEGSPKGSPEFLNDEVVKARLASAGQPVPRDALHRLAVKAELAAGLDSPAEDEALRLEVQVERLRAGLSGGDAREDARSLADAWCRLGPKDDAVEPLRRRFFAALDAIA